MEAKKCTKCGVEKPYNEFYKKRATKDGYRPECKECTKVVNQKYVNDNPEKVAEIRREYKRKNKDDILYKEALYREKNREEIRRRAREWARANADKTRPYRLEYYKNNRITILERNSLYDKENPQGKVIREQRRRARKQAVLNTLTKEQWEYSLAYFNHSCCYCGRKENLQQEHFIALSRGGGYSADNIIPACGTCNASKNRSEFMWWYSRSENFNLDRVDKIYRYISEVSGGDALSHG